MSLWFYLCSTWKIPANSAELKLYWTCRLCDHEPLRQGQLLNLGVPVQNERARPLVKQLLRILRQKQHSIKPRAGSYKLHSLHNYEVGLLQAYVYLTSDSLLVEFIFLMVRGSKSMHKVYLCYWVLKPITLNSWTTLWYENLKLCKCIVRNAQVLEDRGQVDYTLK